MSNSPTTSQLILFGVSDFLTKKVEAHNLKVKTVVNPHTAFSSKHPISVTPSEYIKVLLKNFETSPGVMVFMLIYIEKLLEAIENQYKLSGGMDQILFSSYNSHSMILTAFALAHKYCEDRNYRLRSIAMAGGIGLDQLILLEDEFLNFIDYDLYVSETTFNEYVSSIVLYSRHKFHQNQP